MKVNSGMDKALIARRGTYVSQSLKVHIEYFDYINIYIVP